MSYTNTSNRIKLNHPNKVLGVNVSSIIGTDYWNYANSPSDPWYSGSASPRYYRWRVTFSVTEQEHGSNLTRDDFAYNGLDIQINDWVAGATDGKCLKIVSIESKTKTSVTCIVEDWLRYNTFQAATGLGIFNTGPAVVFSLNENGMPVLDPLPSSVSQYFFATVTSRFSYLNPQLNYVLDQVGHNFVKGDIVSVTGNGFVKSNAETAAQMIGMVSEPGPGPDKFILQPHNRIVDFEPNIPGAQGDSIYVAEDGTLTNSATRSNKIAFLNITGSIPTVLTGDTGNPSITNGYEVTINGTDFTLSGASSSANLTEIVNIINTGTANTKVVASTAPEPTVIVSSSVGTAYDLVGGYPPFGAIINGTTVDFTTTGSQFPGVSTPEDMAFDINAAGVPNLVASATATVLTLTETAGGLINIINNGLDANANPFVGTSNVSGLPASTAGSGEDILVFTRDDGGEVLIYEDSDLFQTSTGIYSGQTGSLPLAINIEQGVRTGGVTVVADEAARDALYAIAGDMAYVVNGGFNEWIVYLYTGSAWTQISSFDSSTVDARTLTTTFTMPIAGGGSVTQQNIGSVSPGRKITTVSVTVDSAVTGGTLPAQVEVGTLSSPSLFMSAVSSDLSTVDDYIVMPEYVYPSTSTEELLVQARLTHYTATAGTITIKVTYL